VNVYQLLNFIWILQGSNANCGRQELATCAFTPLTGTRY